MKIKIWINKYIMKMLNNLFGIINGKFAPKFPFCHALDFYPGLCELSESNYKQCVKKNKKNLKDVSGRMAEDMFEKMLENTLVWGNRVMDFFLFWSKKKCIQP